MITVTPVRTGPLPTSSGPSPCTRVVWPTRTPRTSVMALFGPGSISPMTIPTPRARTCHPPWDMANRAKEHSPCVARAPAAGCQWSELELLFARVVDSPGVALVASGGTLPRPPTRAGRRRSARRRTVDRTRSAYRHERRRIDPSRNPRLPSRLRGHGHRVERRPPETGLGSVPARPSGGAVRGGADPLCGDAGSHRPGEGSDPTGPHPHEQDPGGTWSPCQRRV